MKLRLFEIFRKLSIVVGIGILTESGLCILKNKVLFDFDIDIRNIFCSILYEKQAKVFGITFWLLLRTVQFALKNNCKVYRKF